MDFNLQIQFNLHACVMVSHSKHPSPEGGWHLLGHAAKTVSSQEGTLLQSVIVVQRNRHARVTEHVASSSPGSVG